MKIKAVKVLARALAGEGITWREEPQEYKIIVPAVVLVWVNGRKFSLT